MENVASLGSPLATNRANRAIEVSSIFSSLPPTIFLAFWPDKTEAWMWQLWALGSFLGLLWSFRMRAWGFMLLNGTYFTLDVIGLLRLLKFM